MNVGTVITDAILNLTPMRRGFADGKKEAEQFARQTETQFDRLKGSAGRVSSAVKEIFSGAAIGAGMAIFQNAIGLVGRLAGGVKEAVLGLNMEAENASAKINAFTKNTELTAEILAAVRKEASLTPFAFAEMAQATGALLPVAKGANVNFMELLKTAEILAASNPMQGLEGASIALREAMSGDFGSLIARFDLPRTMINDLREQGVPNLEIVRRAMLEMGYDADLVAGMAETMGGRWSTLMDSFDTIKIAGTQAIFDALKLILRDIQPLIDNNIEGINAFAASIGQRLGAAITAAFAFVMRLTSAIGEWRDAFNGVTSAGERLGKADWADRVTGKIANIRHIFDLTLGTFEQLRSSIMDRDFVGGGIFEEDAPLMTAIFKFHEAIDLGKQKIAELRSFATDKAAATGITMPSVPEGAPSGGQVGLAVGAGAAALGVAALLPALGGLLPMITPIMAVLPALGSMLAALVSPIGLLVAGIAVLGVAWHQNWFDIQGRTAEAIEVIKPKVMELGTFLQETVWPLMQEVWEKIKIAVFDVADAVGPPIDRFVGYLRDDLWPQLQEIGRVALPALVSLGDTAIGAFQSIVPHVLNLVDAVRDIAAVAMPIVVKFGGLIVDSLGPAISAILSFVRDTIPLITQAWENVIRIATPIINGILQVITQVFGRIATFIRENSATISTVLEGVWSFITGVIQVAFSVVTGIVQAGLRIISGDWSGAWGEIKQMFSEVWEGIKQIATAATTVLGGILVLAWEGIKNAAREAWEWIRDRIGDLSGEISRKLDSWSAGLKTALDTAAGGIKSAILSPFEGARDAIGGIVTAFVDKMKGPLQSGINAIGKFGNGVGSAINWISEKLNAGVKVGEWAVPQLSSGTKNWGGGWAWVGEGPGGAGAELAYLPRGAQVIPHRESMRVAQQMGIEPPKKGASLPGFALGLGDIPGLGGLMDFFGAGADKVVDLALKAAGVGAPGLPGVMGEIGGKLLGTVTGWLVEKVKGWLADILPQGGDLLNKALGLAESKVGLPYQWGGENNPSFDCSGFVKWLTQSLGLGDGMPRVVRDIFGWSRKGRNPLLTFGFNNPDNPDPKVQHMGIGIAQPGGAMKWFEAGGRAGGVGPTSDYWQLYGYPPALDNMAAFAGGPGGSGGTAPWNTQAPDQVVQWLVAGLQSAGKPLSWLTGADIIAYHESGYDPNAINLWDSNAKAGNPSMGLMQVIRDHFASGENPYNPVDNVRAASRYIGTRYKDMYAVPGPRSILAGGPYLPYAKGGVIGEEIAGIGMDSGIRYLMGEAGKELVIPVELMGTLYMYFMMALSTGDLDNMYLSRFPAEMRPILRATAQSYMNKSPGYKPGGPGGPPPRDPAGNILPRAGSIPPVDPSTYSEGGPPPRDPAGNILPRGGTAPFPEVVAPDLNFPGIFKGMSGKLYARDGQPVRHYTARYFIGTRDGAVYDGYTGNMVTKGNGSDPATQGATPTTATTTTAPTQQEPGAGSAAPPSHAPFPEEVAPDVNFKGLFVGKSGKVYAPDGEQVKFYTARYWKGVTSGNVWDGYTGKMVTRGDGKTVDKPHMPDTTGLNNRPDVAPPAPTSTAPEPTSGGRGGGGVATIRLVINDRTVVLSGIEIVREIVSNDIALDELAEGITDVQAEELAKVAESPQPDRISNNN